jgi:uncharacterized membrane protein
MYSLIQWLFTHSPVFYFIQSVWRDEAFTILAAQKPLGQILQNLSLETPFHYILMHYWIILFGTHEVSVRSLSLVAFILATIVVIFWGEKLYPKHWLSWFLPLFFFLNPMLLYYAFEVRAYSWYVLFAVLSMYAYSEKRWKLLTIANVLGFYTHTFFLFIPFVQCIHYVLAHKQLLKEHTATSFLEDKFVNSTILSGLLISPYLLRIFTQAGKLQESWYFPVDFHLIKSLLGNMFVGYEGTPWWAWNYTVILSCVILGLMLLSLYTKTNKMRNVYFLLSALIPLIIVIAISFIKPLFVNRYLIPVTIAEVFIMIFALENIRHALIQKGAAFILLVGVVLFNAWYPTANPKLPIRDTIEEINALKGSDDVVYADSPLVFFETIYYAHDKHSVFLYNPNHDDFPWYVGNIIVSNDQIAYDLPLLPKRAFIVQENGTYEIMYRQNK